MTHTTTARALAQLALLFVGVAASASLARAAGPDIYIWDVLKRPNYVAAYRRMMSGEQRLLEWIATPNQLGRSVTTNAGTVRAGSGCLNRFPRTISGVLPGFSVCGVSRAGRDVGRA
jgi:hypothetical protein